MSTTPVNMGRNQKKQLFVLLELLIALSLFALCILPLVQLPLNALKVEIKSYQQLQLQRASELICLETEVQLFQQKISWKALACNSQEKYLLRDEILTIDLPGWGDKKFQNRCFLWTARKKKGKNGEEHRLLTLETRLRSLDDASFFHTKKNRSAELIYRYQIPLLRAKEGHHV